MRPRGSRSVAPVPRPRTKPFNRVAQPRCTASVASVTQNSYQTANVAKVYDAKNAARDDFAFYRQLAAELSTGSPDFAILDIGCGTGALAVRRRRGTG